MEDKEVISKLHELEKDRSYVLYGMLVGKNREEIAFQIHKSVDTVQKHQTAIYKKFGAKVKTRELYEKVGKIFFLVTGVSEFVSPKKDWIEFNLWVWPPFKLTQMLHEVEQEKVVKETKVITNNVAEPVARQQSFQIIAAMIVIILVIFGGIRLFNLLKTPITVRKPTVTAQIPTITVPETLTITETSTPDAKILFQDNFDKGLSPDWIIKERGKIRLPQGELTVENNESLSPNGYDAWLIKDGADWINYRVDLDYYNVGGNAGMMAIGVRQNYGTFSGIYFGNGWSRWVEHVGVGANNVFDKGVAGTEIRKKFDLPAKISVLCEGQKFTFMANGEEINTFISSANSHGGIVLYLMFNAFVDNLSVTKLP